MELVIKTTGEIVTSNFEEFEALAIKQIESLKKSLETDADFAEAENNVKKLTAFEKQLADADEEVLKQMQDVYKLTQGIRSLKRISSEARLNLQKQIKQQKEIVKNNIVSDAVQNMSYPHPDQSSARARIEAALKGKRNLETMIESAKDEAEKMSHELRTASDLIESAINEHGASLFPDKKSLITKSLDVINLEIERRIERKQAEEKAAAEKAEREAREKIEREEQEKKLKEEQERRRELERLAKEKEEQQATPAQEQEQEPKEQQTKVTDQENTPEELEMIEFKSSVLSVFAELGDLRKNLKHPANKEKAFKFAKICSDAFYSILNID